MERYLIYIRLKPFLRQWLCHAFGDPVRFPARSPENAFLRRHVQLRPAGVPPDTAGEGLTAIVLPTQGDRKVEYWNYLTDADRRELGLMIDGLFTLAWYADLREQLARPGINAAVHDWCRHNGIGIDHEDTVVQRINRWRRECAKSGVNLFFKPKKVKSHPKTLQS